MFGMKRRLGIMLLIFVLIATGCSTTTSKTADETPTMVAKSMTESVVQVDYFSDLFALDDMNNADITAMLASESYDDLVAASPFYTSDIFRLQFEDQQYFEMRNSAIEETIRTGDQMYENGQKLTLMIEEAQKVILAAYADKAESESVISAYYQTMLNDYSDEMMYLSLLKAQIDGLEAATGDAYTDAWFSYMRVTKQNDFTIREIAWVARLVQDAVLLRDAYPNELKDLEDEVVSLNAKEADITVLMDQLNTVLYRLDALEKADAYATVSLLKYLENYNLTIQPSIRALVPREGLDAESIELAISTNAYMIESIRLMGATLVDLYQLDERYATGEKQTGMEAFSLTSAVFMAASSEDTTSESALADAKATLNKVPKKTEPPGFFNVMYNAIRKVPGILIEKTSTAVYKQALNYYADDYGLDESVFDEDKVRADKEAYHRIQSGTAGSETIHSAQAYITSAEESIGKLSDAMLGKDSTLSKVIKGSSKFAIGCFTGASKSMLTLMDPTATAGDLAKASVDVTLAAAGSSKTVEKIFKAGKSKVLSFFGIKASTATAVKETTKTLLGKASNFLSKAKSTAGNFIESAIGSVNQASKFGKFITGAGEVLSKATTTVVESSKKLFTSMADSTSKIYKTFTGKMGTLAQKTVENESLIGKAVGSSYGEVLEGYVKGSVYDKIPTFVNSTLAWVKSETETASAAEGVKGDASSLNDAAEAAAMDALNAQQSNAADDSAESDENSSMEAAAAGSDYFGNEAVNTTDAADTNAEVNINAEANAEAENSDTENMDTENMDTENMDTGNMDMENEDADTEKADAEDANDKNVNAEDAGDDAAITEVPSSEIMTTDNASLYEGTYKGAFQPSTIAGMAFDFNASNSSLTMTVAKNKITIVTTFDSPMLEGDTMTFNQYSIDDAGKMKLTRIDDEGDKQVINVQFLDAHKITGTVTLFDGNAAMGDLKFSGQ
ncbi:MAG: hypothetical protein PWP51_777 [Clostridiales bacterium]|nr:hypothetical protein [Clostridiales bacterium]